MRPLLVACFVATGCSVDVGAGTFAVVSVYDPIEIDGVSPPLSIDDELDFLAADDSATIADQYGSKLKAVKAIDVDVKILQVEDSVGTVIPAASVVVTCDGVAIDKPNKRVRLAPVTEQKVLQALRTRSAVTLPVTLLLDWPGGAPTWINIHAEFQPIVVVDALQAL